MHRPLSLILAVGIASCTETGAGDDATATAAASLASTVGSTDPIDHLKVIAGPEMDGRNTPSVGLDRAQDYVIEACMHARLTPALPDGAFKQPFPIAGTTANNIVAMLPGNGASDELVLVLAHLDHLGHGFPGADDDGSGSAAMIAIANRLAATRAARPLDRTVAFLWTAGEEKGLVGSAYFADHPLATLPLARIVQAINLDAIGALDDTRFSILLDDATNSQRTALLINEVSADMEPPFVRINQDLQAYTQRTDGYSFTRRRVPTIWVSEGLMNPLGGGSLMPRYHRATDTVENLLAENGGNKLRRMTTMLTGTVEKLASSRP